MSYFQDASPESLGISSGGILRFLDRMEEKGLIRRTAVKSDARLKKIEITPQGLAVAQHMEKCIAAMEAELSKGISEQEKQAFLKTLQKINQNLGGTACPEKE